MGRRVASELTATDSMARNSSSMATVSGRRSPLDAAGAIFAASTRQSTAEVELSRFSLAGSLDSSFGNGGRATLPSAFGPVTSIGVLSDRRVVTLSHRAVGTTTSLRPQ